MTTIFESVYGYPANIVDTLSEKDLSYLGFTNGDKVLVENVETKEVTPMRVLGYRFISESKSYSKSSYLWESYSDIYKSVKAEDKQKLADPSLESLAECAEALIAEKVLKPTETIPAVILYNEKSRELNRSTVVYESENGLMALNKGLVTLTKHGK